MHYNTTESERTIRRYKYIDIIRGIAILLMIFAHIVAFFWVDNQNDVLGTVIYLFGQLGGIVSFSIFLFLSGVSINIAYLSKVSLTDKKALKAIRSKILLRGAKILVIYYLLAVLSLLTTTTYFSWPFSVDWIEQVIKILTFQVVPGFVEFLLAFAIFHVIIAFLPRSFVFIAKNIGFVILLSVIFTLLGFILQNITLIDIGIINNIKVLLAGESVVILGNVFPILQYFFVLLFGLSFGNFIQSQTFRYFRNKVFIITVILTSLLFGTIFIFHQYFPEMEIFKYSQDVGRFPPTLGFLVFSSFLSILILSIYSVLEKFVPGLIKLYLYTSGNQAMGFFVFHTIIIFVFGFLDSSGNPIMFYKTNLPISLLAQYLLLLLFTFILVQIKNIVKSSVTKGKESGSFLNVFWFFSPQFVRFLMIFIGITFLLGNSSLANSYRSFDEKGYVLKKNLIPESDWPIWWDNSYLGYVQLTSKKQIGRGVWVNVELNLQDMFAKGYVKTADGKDIILLRYDDNLVSYINVPSLYEVNSNNISISFKTSQDILPNDQNYFIYFGNELPADRNISTDRYVLQPNSTDFFNISEVVINSIESKINKKWHLKKISRAFGEATLEFEINTNSYPFSSKVSYTYVVEGTQLRGRMQKVTENVYRATVKVSDLEPGTYKIYSAIYDYEEGIKVVRSRTSIFYVTYPLYVAWTMDWEGWDVAENDLNEIADIAKKYNMPITHFFNPRVYVKNQYTINPISEERAQYITRWVSDRKQKYFEEIGMHIHMWGDMVAEAGVTPRYQYIVGTYGVDVPTYVYTEDELVKVFDWGRSKLAENGLGVPISYRTGAWMSGVNVLRAAERAGFKIDSSGRTGGPVNPAIASSTPVPWSLSTTTRPYLPNNNDINSWTAPMKDRMKIWEYPNNGADSYWFSTADLISRFNDNYPVKNQILQAPQVVNYLSHPHWFVSMDKWKIRGVLDYTNQFLLSNDSGPVVYETLERIYADWEKDKFYNGN